jgi:hypothetical protein
MRAKDDILSMIPGGVEMGYRRVIDLRGLNFQLELKYCLNIEKTRQDPAAYLKEYHRIRSPWEVRFEGIVANKIIHYHGMRDTNCSYRGAQWMHARFDKRKCPSNLVLEDLDDHYMAQEKIIPLLREVMSSKRW